MAGDKDGKSGGSYLSQAVSQFMAPVTIAWLLAVGGLLAWNMSLTALFQRVGQLAIFAGSATAFLTVVLTLIEDAVSDKWKRKFLFPRCKQGHPSYYALDKKILDRAQVSEEQLPTLTEARDRPDDLNRIWFAFYNAHREHLAIAHFSQRWIAWLQTAPLLAFLTLISLVVALAGPSWGSWIDRDHWLWLTAVTAVLAVLGYASARGVALQLVAEVVKQMSVPVEEHETANAPREDD
ncbi:MAG TPA: hypothetical protein VH331_17865 [Allosphingosinicella sp.]|jgi:hypothetical protein|nr:hypothetical protein [Allosphingosinicella sp.]